MSFLSCENTSIEQDMSKYCDCRKKLLKKEVQQKACLDIQNEISIKYEFDPEASAQIKKEIKKCNRDINEQFK
jgi:hypothetical protein